MSEARAVTPSPAELVELVVLGCLSTKTPPSDEDLGCAVHELCLRQKSPDEARIAAMDVLGQLCQRGFIEKRALTAAGKSKLRSVCRTTGTPAWSTFRQRYFPAIALGVIPGPAKKNAKDAMAQRLARRLGLDEAHTMNALCDALIVSTLGMTPGKLTIARIRAHVLALRTQSAVKRTPEEPRVDRQDAQIATPTKLATPPAADEPGSGVTPPVTVSSTDVRAPDLLTFVRETLTEIGDEGRFGNEKVFVSALWHELAHRGPPAELSLDHFKQWLVTANRNRWLTLARADVVGAMDPKKVRESEIQDRGATFHFVLDPGRNPAAQQGATHVR